MKKLYKGLIAAVLSITLIMSLVVTSWGAAAALADGIMGDLAKDFLKWCLTPTTVNEGEDEIVEATNYINSVWRTAGNCTGTVEVTYQTMSDLVVDLNMNGIPCQIGMWRGSGATGYVIKGTGKTPVCGGVVKVDITGKYFTNTVGAAFLAKSKSEITAPDTSTTTPTTPTINFDDTNIVNAVEGVFDQLTWVIRCQFEQMQDTLVNGRILLNINNLISKNVIPFLEDILVADSSTSSTLQALYQSFENKFSDLDNMFGTDTSMTVHNGDLLTWDNSSRGFTSATADGTTNTVRLTPTKTLNGYKIGWSSDGYFNIVPAGGGTFPDTLDVGTGTVTMPVIATSEKVTVPNPALNEHVPSGYTQYEKFSPYSTTPIDLGVVPVSGMQFEAGVSVTASTANPTQPQYFFGVDGLSMAVAQNKQALEVRSGTNSYSYSLNFNGSAHSLFVYWKFGTSWRHGGMSNGITMSSFPSTSKTLYLGQANGISPIERFPQTGGGYTSTYNYATSRWNNITIKDSSDNLLYEFVPCKRNSDGMAGLYRVEYNAGTYTGGTFISCDDDSADYHLSNEIPLTVETTVTKPGNIVRIYRDSGNFWYARSADGTTQNFDAISTVALVKAFPVYEYSSLSQMTSLPDGTYRISWSGTAQTVTINYQAYSKFFTYIANQITFNRNWLDERLNHLNISADSITVDAYDDTTLLGKLDDIKTAIENITIPAADNTAIIAALGRIEAQLGDLNVNLGDLNINGSEFDDTDILNAINSISAYDDTTLLGVLTDINTRLTNIDVSLSTGTGNTPVDLSPILESITGIAATQRDIAASLSALNSSFEYKFSELDSVFDEGYIDDSIYPYQEFPWDAVLRDNLMFDYDAGYTVNSIAVLPLVTIPDWIVSTDGSDKYLAVPSSGVFPDTLETAGGTITFPSGVQSIYCDVFTGKWYMNTTSSQGISFNEATNTLLKQVFPVYVYSSFWEITSFPDGKFVMFWTGTLPFVNIRFLQHSRFFSRLISVIENTHGEKMDVLLDIYNALENIPGVGDITVSPTDLTPVITSIDAVGVNIEDLNASLNANFNTNIGSLLDKLDIVIEGSSESLENRINITIDASNEAYNVFYVTGEDGETQSVTEFTGDLTSASGRLLSLLYRLVFADTLSGVDDDLDGFEDFFTSQGDDTSTQSMESPYEESENVWLVS